MENITAIIADIAEPFMGLTEETYNRAPWLQQLWDATWYPEGQQNKEPYCAAGVMYCIKVAKEKEPRISLKYRPQMADVKGFTSWALKPENGCLTFRWTGPNGTETPQRGDIVIFTWSHVGIVSGSPIMKKDLGTHIIPTYEFNTSSGMKGSQRDGGGNYKRERLKSDCSLFVRLPVKAERVV